MIIGFEILSFNIVRRDDSAPIDVTASQNQAIASPKHLVEKKCVGLLLLDFDEGENQTDQRHRQESIDAETFVSQAVIADIF